MPTLIIMRHAEAVPSKSDDHGRVLSAQGRADAAAVGRSLQARLSGSLLVLASDARRTMQTAELAFTSYTPAPEIRSKSELYAAPPPTLLRCIQSVSGSHDLLALVGHNPGISALAKQLVASGSAEDRARVDGGLPTAVAAIFNFDTPWSAIAPRAGRLTATVAPDGASWAG